ncbi:MAG TPA: hypothetical protein VKD90_20700 [Gemmataceae bacterium]|nr:hypothetical protein [Gemmataceae bacterium]
MTARYRAPSDDGGLLADPPLADIEAQLEANARRLIHSSARVAGVPLSEFRRGAIEEVLGAARQYLAEGGELAPPSVSRLLVAGHQPDFFHPGVWVKKFVLHGLAARYGAAPLNLVVDNDVLKAAAIRVPVVADDPAKVTALQLPFDRPEGEKPHEEYRIRDRGLFDSFLKRLAERARSWGFEPLAFHVWPMIGSELDRGATLGTAASRVRRSLERRWGVTNFELPVSRLAATRAFAGFAYTLLADLPRFSDAYNAALAAYRRANKLRSPTHPAPDLGSRGEWLEAPFWAWRTDAPRRAKLFARRTEGGIELQAGDQLIGRTPPETAAFAGRWSELAADGWRVRPRALTLTMFARLCLADGFIHGIGGGKYDEVTDTIIRRFFGIEPPGYAVVSATLRLPLKRFPATAEALHQAERRVRDLQWNPERFSEAQAQFPELAARKPALVRDEPATRPERRRWFRRLQAVTRELRPAVEGRLAEAEATVARIRAELQGDVVLASREYAWPLFPESHLREFFTRLQSW